MKQLQIVCDYCNTEYEIIIDDAKDVGTHHCPKCDKTFLWSTISGTGIKGKTMSLDNPNIRDSISAITGNY